MKRIEGVWQGYLGLAVAVGVSGALLACGGNPGVTACKAYADAFAQGAADCGGDYDTNYNVLDAILGGCDNMVSVRDETSFYNDCIPWIEALTCTQLNSTTLGLPSSCQAQLQR